MTLIKYINDIVKNSFEKSGYVISDEDINKIVSLSDRPDLSQFQSNIAFKLAKEYKKNPRLIANDVLEELKKEDIFENLSIDGPGFININIKDEFLISYINKIFASERFGVETSKRKIFIDYGGANVAKPLHIGHLRSAIIGEGLKRLAKELGHEVICDVHLGDWGRQMGMVISEIEIRQPDLVYFNEEYNGEYPKESPVTINELEEIYPTASENAKHDEDRMEKSREATAILQESSRKGHKGYYALWEKLVDISKEDLKRIYGRLGVSFDLWKGESDSFEHIPKLMKLLDEKHLIHDSDGAKVMFVNSESDNVEIPPLIIKTKNNTVGYQTTELATMLFREEEYHPDEIWYVVDERQKLHFTQCFRAAKKANIVSDNTDLKFIGFGTMNGKDGKPFKTRDGGVMKLVDLLDLVKEKEKEILKQSNEEFDSDELEEIANIISQASIKYADALSNRETDYIFDVDKFTSIQGKTGPYIVYSVVRINSMLKKAKKLGINIDGNLIVPQTEEEKKIMFLISRLPEILEKSIEEKSLSIVANYLYDLNSAFNNFYNNIKILSEENQEKKESWLKLSSLIAQINKKLLYCLVIDIPKRM